MSHCRECGSSGVLEELRILLRISSNNAKGNTAYAAFNARSARCYQQAVSAIEEADAIVKEFNEYLTSRQQAYAKEQP